MICKIINFVILLSLAISFISAQDIVFPGPTTSYANRTRTTGTTRTTTQATRVTSSPSQNTTSQTTVSPTSQTTNSTSQQTINDCVQRCPKTAEYNPICGTDNNFYTNPSYLKCQSICSNNPDLKEKNVGLCPDTPIMPQPNITRNN